MKGRYSTAVLIECSINGTLVVQCSGKLIWNCFVFTSFSLSLSHDLVRMMEGRNVPDCTSCKLVGATGCFAGAAYAMYERAKIPAGNKNRVWLAVISVGGYSDLPMREN